MSSVSQPDEAEKETPQSGLSEARLPAIIGNLLSIAASIDKHKTLASPLCEMLDELIELEPGAVVGLRLSATAKQDELLFVRTPVELDDAVDRGSDRMFPEFSSELSVPLPGADPGRLHFAAPTFLHSDTSTYGQFLIQVAAVLRLALRRFRDRETIDDLKGQTVQLQKLASIGESAASVVHELNNPLTAIIAYSDFLMKRLEKSDMDEAIVDRLSRIHEAANRIQQFSRQLIDYSRPASSFSGPVAISSVIDRALGFCMHLLRSSDIAVERSYRDVPLIQAMETPLTQVFVNLITNAWHAMDDAGGTLRITIAHENDRVIVGVLDEGYGIAEKHVARVFDTYFTTKAKGTGVGLGLSIVQQVIHDHGGTIAVSNRDPKGVAFCIELPIRSDG